MKCHSVLILFTLIFSLYTQASEALKFSDVFDFKYAKSTQLSERGQVLAFSATPYRGDAKGHVSRQTDPTSQMQWTSHHDIQTQ